MVADDSAERERLWRFREAPHRGDLGAPAIPHKLDVGVPLARLAEFAARVRAEVARLAPGARVILFGHLGDGNVHVNVLGLEPGDDAVDEAVLRARRRVRRHDQRRARRRRGQGALAGARALARRAARDGAIKRALDPDGLLNPGVMLP